MCDVFYLTKNTKGASDFGGLNVRAILRQAYVIAGGGQSKWPSVLDQLIASKLKRIKISHP